MKYIQAQAEEWGTLYYLNYKGLKKIIQSTGTTSTTAGMKTNFFFTLERELDKINSFYLQKESECHTRLDQLIAKKRIYASNPTSLTNLKEAFTQFQFDLAQLQKFVEVNATGFRKILKKYDKNTKQSTKELYLSRQVDIQPCFNKDILTKLTDTALFHEKDIEALLLTLTPDFGFSFSRSAACVDSEQQLADLVVQTQPDALSAYLRSEAFTSIQDKEYLSRVLLSQCFKAPLQNITHLLESQHAVININISNDISNRTLAHESAALGNMDILRLLVRFNADCMTKDIYDKLPMHHAAMNGHAECIAFLLETAEKVTEKQSIRALDCDGNTALVYAIRSLRVDAVRVVVEAGAELGQENGTGLHALSIACLTGSLEICGIVLERMRTERNDVAQGGVEFVDDVDGVTALHIAARAGHVDILELLIGAGADIDQIDGLNGWSSIFYAASEGNLACCQLLVDAGCDYHTPDTLNWHPSTYAIFHGHKQTADLLLTSIRPLTPLNISKALFDTLEDGIPSLSLPPPILPFRIYGHNYLKATTRLRLSFPPLPITLFKRRTGTPLKLVVTSYPDTFPHTLLFPVKDKDNVTYTVTDPTEFGLTFEIYPAFGSNLVGKGCLTTRQLLRMFARGCEKEVVVVALMGSGFECVGEVEVRVDIVRPFCHEKLVVGGKADVYWKSTARKGLESVGRVGNALITATSLSNHYTKIKVFLTKDGVPVVHPASTIAHTSLSLPIHSLTLHELLGLLEGQDKATGKQCKLNENQHTVSHKLLNHEHVPAYLIADLASSIASCTTPLASLLQRCEPNISLAIELDHQSCGYTRDEYVDKILQTVFDYADSGRSCLFISYDEGICASLNWKQPNFGVFFGVEKGASLKEAVRFARMSNLLGLIVEASPLIKMPVLVKRIKESGLLVCSYGSENADAASILSQESSGVDAFLDKNVFKNRA